MIDELTRIVVPGGAAENWPAGQLLSPPSLPAGLGGGVFGGNPEQWVLNAVNEAVGTSPNTGFTWPEGRHRVRFLVSGLTFTTSTVTFSYRVRDITGGTDNGDATTASKVLGGSGTAVHQAQWYEVEFDSVGGNLYQPQVVVTQVSGGSQCSVREMAHTFIPAIGQNEQAHSDPENNLVHKRDVSGDMLVQLETEGVVPFYVEPGLTAIFIVPLDVPRPGYTEPESVKGRTVTVTAKGAPRSTG